MSNRLNLSTPLCLK
ncbi:hypothetical protein [Roseivirga sp. 4D4]